MPLHVSSTRAHHQEVTYRCDDTRCCIVQFWPPDDEHVCSKHIEAWNKLIIKFSASSWLILREIIGLFSVFLVEYLQYRGPGSSVGIATDYGLDG